MQRGLFSLDPFLGGCKTFDISLRTEVATEGPEHALVPALTLISEDGPMVETLEPFPGSP